MVPESVFQSNCNSFAYRLPGSSEVHYCNSCQLVEGISTGFVVAPFEPNGQWYTLLETEPKDKLQISIPDLPLKETPLDEYMASVKGAIKALDENLEHKIVVSRVIDKELPRNISQVFAQMQKAYPQAFVFYFHTELHGRWLGASPETLLRANNGRVKSMALAGTQTAQTSPQWDDKNRREQAIVTSFIKGAFEKAGLNPLLSETYTRQAGPVCHLCTDIEAHIGDAFNLESLLRNLSPTPALSGFPKEWAIKELQRLEQHQRYCYGGFCGPFRGKDDFDLFVNLRSMNLGKDKIHLFAGGGITALSDAQEEYKETARKAHTLLRVLVS